ncbi:MAG: hypothetical protein RI861_05045, partial [Planktomarina sp.]|nr:hypothetical protein [Planktomarina sp.]
MSYLALTIADGFTLLRVSFMYELVLGSPKKRHNFPHTQQISRKRVGGHVKITLSSFQMKEVTDGTI